VVCSVCCFAVQRADLHERLRELEAFIGHYRGLALSLRSELETVHSRWVAEYGRRSERDELLNILQSKLAALQSRVGEESARSAESEERVSAMKSSMSLYAHRPPGPSLPLRLCVC
jgi:hypothetical protein